MWKHCCTHGCVSDPAAVSRKYGCLYHVTHHVIDGVRGGSQYIGISHSRHRLLLLAAYH